MSDTDPLVHLAAWLGPASANPLTSETVGRRRQAVELVTSLDVDELVASAHGHTSDALALAINEHLSATDDAYVAAKKPELVGRVAAASLMQILSVDGEEALRAAQLVGSARFLKLTPMIKELHGRAAQVEQSARGRARERIGLKEPGPTLRQQVDAAEELEIDELRRGFQGLARRFDQVVSDLESRLQLMDEETNALWWSQDPRSETSGELWADMKPLARVATASIEAGQLNRRRPATKGLIRVAKVVAGPVGDETVQLGKVADAFSRLVARKDIRATLLPIHSCVGLASEYEKERSAISAVARTTLGWSTTLQVTLADVPEQYLRELSLLAEA